MCEPTTILAGASLAMTAIGGIMGAQQQQAQGAALAQQAQYQAAVARNNQVLAERSAQDALDRGGAEEAKSRMQTRRLIGQQRAALAANGVVVDQGSALTLTTDSAALGELDAQTIRSNAEREALNARIQGMNFGAEAALKRQSGRAALTDARLGSTATLLSTGGSVASKWYSMM